MLKIPSTHEPLASSRSHRGNEVAGQNPVLTSGATRFLGAIRDKSVVESLHEPEICRTAPEMGESFVVERFSAVVVSLRNILKSALKRSTTNLASEGSWSQCAPKKEWGLPMNLRVESEIPLTFVLSPATWERKSPNRATAPRCDLLSPCGRGRVRGISSKAATHRRRRESRDSLRRFLSPFQSLAIHQSTVRLRKPPASPDTGILCPAASDKTSARPGGTRG